jgi:hypothetical protein
MQSNTEIAPASRKKLWIGRIMSYIAVLFMFLDGTIKVLRLEQAVEATVQLGYPESLVITIGVLELICIVVYVIPQTSILGAILLTGYLGGAVTTNLRIGTPLFSHILFPIYLGILIWGGLFLRDNVLRTLIPLRKTVETETKKKEED